MKRFCSSSRKHATNVINFEKKMLQLTRKELKLIHDAAACCTCGKRFAKDKIYQNVRDHCHYTGKYRGARHSTCNQKFNVPNQKNSCHLLSQWIN